MLVIFPIPVRNIIIRGVTWLFYISVSMFYSLAYWNYFFLNLVFRKLFLSRCVLNYAESGRFYGDLVEDGVREAGLRDADSEEKRTRKTGGLGGLFFGGWRHFVLRAREC